MQAADNGSWEYALYQGDCCLLERGKIDAPELMIEEVRDEIMYTHNLRNKDCIPLTQEEFAQKLADRNDIQSYRMKQFQQSGHDCYLVMQPSRITRSCTGATSRKESAAFRKRSCWSSCTRNSTATALWITMGTACRSAM